MKRKTKNEDFGRPERCDLAAHRRIDELEEEVEAQRREIERLKSESPEPPPLRAGTYRGTIVEAEEMTSMTGRKLVRIKIAEIDAFPRNVIWHHLRTQRPPSPYEKLRGELGKRNWRYLEGGNGSVSEIDDPKHLIGCRVQFFATIQNYGGRPRNAVKTIERGPSR